MKVNPHKSSLGLEANILALLSYIAAFVLSWIPFVQYVAWLAPLVIFLLEKQSPFVKFHSMQALLLEVILWVFQVVIAIITAVVSAAMLSVYSTMYYYDYGSLSAALGIITMLGVIVLIIELVFTVFAIIAMIKAYGYEEFKIPVLGNLAEKFSKKNIASQ
jgi:uncharacterized membrane protein